MRVPLPPRSTNLWGHPDFLKLWTGQALGDMARIVYMINATSLRQAITPYDWLGRINASMQFCIGGAAMLGLLAGGFAGEWFGIRTALAISLLGSALAFIWLWYSPVRQLPSANRLPVTIKRD